MDGRTKGFVGDAEGLRTVTTRLSPSLYKLTAVTLNGSGPVRRAYCVLVGLEIEAKQELSNDIFEWSKWPKATDQSLPRSLLIIPSKHPSSSDRR